MKRQLCRIHERHLHRLAVAIVLFFGALLLPVSDGVSAATLDRIKQTGKIMFGYRTDARPFSYEDAGKATGFSVDLCQRVADDLKTELGLPALAVEWVPIKLDERISAIQQGKIDLLCGADTVTLTARKDVSFSTPIYPSGTGAILRQETFDRLKDVLIGEPGTQPIWRGSPALISQGSDFRGRQGHDKRKMAGGAARPAQDQRYNHAGRHL